MSGSWLDALVASCPPFARPRKDKVVNMGKKQLRPLIKSIESQDLSLIEYPDPIGYAVVTNRAIRKKECVSIYSGVLSYGSEEPNNKNSSGYDFSISYEENFFSIYASTHGNWSRFFSHLPTESMLDEYYTFTNSEIREQVATENLTPVMIGLRGLPGTIFSSNREILEGEPVGFVYKSVPNFSPALFSKNAELISEDDYEYRPLAHT